MEMFGEFEDLLNALTFGGGKAFNLRDYPSNGLPAKAVQSHFSYTFLDITGKGMLVTLSSSRSTMQWAVQADGGTIYELMSNTTGDVILFLPFTTSLKVTNYWNIPSDEYAFAILGDSDDWSKWTPVNSMPTAASHLANTILDIAGKGILLSVYHSVGSYKEARIQVDGGTIHTLYMPSSYGAAHAFVVPFASSLKITSDDTSCKAIYKLV
ncbi:MAG: hypothetical protein ACOY93_13590 [Bacillota bacterium]